MIIPFFDERAYLRSALNSVFSQGIDALQVIVVNDNPDAFSPTSMAVLAGSRAELVQHPRNLGLSAARNSGLARARGRFVAFLDADDFYVTAGLARQFGRAVETDADITHAQTYFSRPGNSTIRLLPRDAAMFSRPETAHGLQNAERAQFIVSSWSSIYRRDFLTRNNLHFDEEQPRFEDRLFVLHTLTRAGKITFLGQPTRVWRGRAGSISATPSSPETDLLKVQLLEKCLAHIGAEVAANRLSPRFLKRELFNTVSRLIWDMDLIDAICQESDPDHAGLGRRIVTLLGQDRFGQAIFNDEVLRTISRVGMKTRRGKITRTAFFAIHKSLREGDFAQARHLIAAGASRPPPRAAPMVLRSGKRRLVLHLGMHKTGSTFLQHHLWRHRARLRQAGVLVPETGFHEDGSGLREGATPGHHGIATAGLRDDPATWAKLADEIAKSGAGTVILSCENALFPIQPERDALIATLADRLAGFDRVDLLALVRRPDAYAEAFYRERVAGGVRMGTGGLGAFLVDHGAALTDFQGLFAPFEACFGTQVRFGDFDALRANCLWAGFTALANLPTELPALDVPRYRTPDRDAILLIEALNAMVEGRGRRDAMLRAWFTLHPQSGTGADSSLLSPPGRLALLDRWQTQSADFAAARGYAPDMAQARVALSDQEWRAPTGIPMNWLRDLIDIAGQTDATGPSVPRSPTPLNKPRSGEMALTVRLRPWAARLARRVVGRTG